MTVTLTATLLTASNPRPVQVVLAGTTAGQVYAVTGTTADGASRTVSGGVGVSAGSSVILTDNRTPLNAPITYQAVVDGVTYTAATVTVTSTSLAVLQTLDGQTIVPVLIATPTEKRKHDSRSTLFQIAGRSDPAARLDVPGSAQYAWQFDTQSTDSVTMFAILASGMPVVRRLTPGMRDLKTSVIGIVTAWDDELVTNGVDTLRRWTLAVQEISDPQPSAVLAAYDWDDFDTAMADEVWAFHATLAGVSGLTATNGTLSSQSTGGYDTANTAFGRLTVTTAATAASVYETAFTAAAATLGTPVIPGMQLTITVRVKGTAGRTVAASLKWSTGAIVSGSTVTLTGSWQEVSVTATAPASTTGVAYGVALSSTGVLSGDQVDFDSVTIAQGATVQVGAFDDLFATWDDFDKADWALYQ